MSTLDGTPETSMSDMSEPGLPEPAEPAPQSPRSPQAATAGTAGPPLDRVEPLNLARRPFLNSRPVVRVSLLLLLLGLALLAWNVVQFQRYLSESADKRAQIEDGEREVAQQQKANSGLQSQLDALDLEQRNQRVELLNQMIDERTFSWSLLLDRLAEVQPNDMRLLRLTPRMDRQQQGRSRARTRTSGAEGGERQILLTIQGETRSDEALNQFVDNLFAHPSFEDPNPTQETRDEASNLVTFDLSVQYIPGGSPQGVVIEEMPTIEEIPPPGAGATPKAPPSGNTPGNPRPPGGSRP